jgi:hypothetical protein
VGCTFWTVWLSRALYFPRLAGLSAYKSPALPRTEPLGTALVSR